MANTNIEGWATDRTVTTADSAPSGASDGVDVSAGDIFAVQTHTLTAITAYDLQLWVYGNAAWSKARQGTFSAVGNNTWADTFDVTCYTRAFVQVSAITGTSLKMSTRVARAG